MLIYDIIIKTAHKTSVEYIFQITIIIYGTAGFHFLEGHPWTIITMSTVGYGDYSPKTPIGMYFAISVLIFGIGSFAAAIETIVATFVEREHNRLMGLIRVKNTMLYPFSSKRRSSIPTCAKVLHGTRATTPP